MKKNREEELYRFQQKIHYEFDDIKLLDQAFRHSSYLNADREKGLMDNERLEFLGDAFLDAIIGECLYKMHPKAEEGKLSKMRAALVCEESLEKVAGRLGLAEHLLLGYGEEKSGGRNRASILADAVEAVIGAIYLDGGYEEAGKFVVYALDEELKDARKGKIVNRDFKSRLQEMLQAQGIQDIKYLPEKEEGPDHEKVFTVKLQVNGCEVSHGTGKSKKSAEQDAAKNAIERGKDAL